MNDNFLLLIRNHTEVLFERPVEYLTSLNEKGEFDILPSHSNFISLIQKKVRFKEVGGAEKEMVFANAVLRFVENKAEVFIGS